MNVGLILELAMTCLIYVVVPLVMLTWIGRVLLYSLQENGDPSSKQERKDRKDRNKSSREKKKRIESNHNNKAFLQLIAVKPENENQRRDDSSRGFLASLKS